MPWHTQQDLFADVTIQTRALAHATRHLRGHDRSKTCSGARVCRRIVVTASRERRDPSHRKVHHRSLDRVAVIHFVSEF